MTDTATALDDAVVDLPARLDFAACETLVASLETARGKALRLNGAEVTFLGALSAEILLRAKREWSAADLPFTCDAPSSAFLQGLDLLGIPHTELLEKEFE